MWLKAIMEHCTALCGRIWEGVDNGVIQCGTVCVP